MSKLTIAIPTYNRKEYLKQSIKSILNQTFQDFEIVVFDNASDYDIAGFLNDFNDNRIKLSRNEENLGTFGNYKKIFDYQFSSPYLVIFHDDDYMHPKLLEAEVLFLEENLDAVFCVSDLNFIQDHKRIESFNEIKDIKVDSVEAHELVRLILKDFDLCYSSVMYRIDRITSPKRLQEIFFKWSDRPHLIEMAKNAKVGVIKNKLVNYRIHQNQDSQSGKKEEDITVKLFSYYRDNLSQPLSKSDKKIFLTWSTNNFFNALSGLSISDIIERLKLFRKNDLFYFRYLNLRGVYYFLKYMKSCI